MKSRIIETVLIMSVLLGCNRYEELLVPLSVIEGTPSGGITNAEVVDLRGDTLDLSISLFAVNHVGNFIDFLEPESVEFVTEHEALPISNFFCQERENTGDATVGMLFDQSGSIASTDPMDARVQAGLEFIELLGSSDEACVHRFSDFTSEVQGLTTNKASLENAIESLIGTTGGGTALYLGIIDVGQVISENNSLSSKAVIAFSDGDNNIGGSFQQVIDFAANSIPIIIIALNEGGAITSQEELSQIAIQTNGAYIEAQNVTGVISAYTSMSEFLTGSYFENSFNLSLVKAGGDDWQGGDAVNFVIRINLPNDDLINYPIQFTI